MEVSERRFVNSQNLADFEISRHHHHHHDLLLCINLITILQSRTTASGQKSFVSLGPDVTPKASAELREGEWDVFLQIGIKLELSIM